MVVRGGVGVSAEWRVEDCGIDRTMGAGEVFVEGREKGVGGRAEYCVGL